MSTIYQQDINLKEILCELSTMKLISCSSKLAICEHDSIINQTEHCYCITLPQHLRNCTVCKFELTQHSLYCLWCKCKHIDFHTKYK